MAAIFKLRRGTSIPSLVESEPFYKTDSDSFHIGDGSTYITLVKIGANTGSVQFTGDISASNLTLSGNATVNGNITFGGSLITLGDANTDNIVITGELSSSLIPNDDNSFDLGSSSKRYKNLHVVSASIENVTFDGTRILSSSLGDYQDFDTFSGSVDSRFIVINSFTSSQETKNTTLQTVTSSFDNRLNNIESFSSSQETKDTTLETVTASFDDRISQLETDSGSQASRLDNIETTTASFDDRISQLESDTGSQDSRLDNLETYTSSNDDNITELFATASDHESRIDVIEGTFSSSVDSRLDYLEGDFSTSVDDRLDQLEVHSGSTDDRLDNIESVSGSYATTGSNLFIGNETITGSLETSGSVRFRGIPWPETGSEHHLFKTDPYTLNISSGDRNYSYLGVALDHYEEDPDYFHNSLIMYTYDDHDNPSYGAELNVGPLRSHMQVLASGSGNLGNISIQDVEDGTTRGLIYADDIQIGVYTGSTIQIGNNGSTVTHKGDLTNFIGGVTVQQSVTASYYVGDGELLTNVTASYVHYNNIDAKPTLVSQSSQIDVNDTQNFTPFSTSVDSRLDEIEGNLSSSVNSQLDNIHSYTSSLKTAFDVSDTNVTVFGDLTVQGNTTTLNTSELNVEDKLITIGSGSTNSAEADGAGIEIAGAGASILWDHTNSQLNVNTKISSSTGYAGDGAEITNIQHGNIVFEGSGIVSGSSQINFTEISNISSNIVSASSDTDRVVISISNGSISADLIGGVVSGSDQVTESLDLRYLTFGGDNVISSSEQVVASLTDGFSTSVKDELNSNEVISGSIQVQYNDISSLPSDIVSASLDTDTISLSILKGTISGSVIGGVVSGSDQVTESLDSRYVNEVDYVTYTASVEDRTSNLEATGSDHEGRINELETTFSSSVDSRLDYLEGDFSTSLDTRLDYLEGDFSSSVDTRLDSLELDTHTHSNKANLDTIDQDLASSDTPSFAGLSLTSLLSQPSGSIEFNALFLSSSNEFTTRTLGDAVLYSVTSSEEVELVSGSISYGSDNLLTAGAVKKYVDWRTEEILDAIGAADITSVTVTGGGGLFGGGLTGDVSLSLDSGSDGFKNAVYSVYGTGIISGAEQLLDVATDFGTGRVSGDNIGNEDGTTTFTGSFVGDGTQLSGVTSYTDADTLDYINSINVISGSVYTPFSTSVDDRLDTLEGASNENPLTFNDTTNVDLIRTGDIITANLKGGVISGSTQLDGTTIGSTSPSTFSGSFSGSFVGDGSQLSGVTSYTDADTLDYINSINVISGSDQVTSSLDSRYEEKSSATHTLLSGSQQVVDSLLNQDIDFGTGGISGSSLDITGNTKIDGNVIVGGNITVGDATSDKITFASNISSSLIPDVSNAFDLGSPTKRWRTLYISGSTIDLGGTLIQRDDVSGNITFLDSGSQTALSAVVGYADITGKPTLVSQSVQIVYGDISSLPTNIVSQSTDSSNVDFTITNGNITANLKGGVVSGSDQVTQSLDSRYLNLSGGESVSGNTTFQDITVNGTGSFAYIQSTTGSAKIIGDAFVIVNSDTPSQRYAGLSVYDSGSTQSSASFFFDGELNDWNYEYSGSGGIDYAVAMFGPEYNTKGNPTYLTDNTIPKAVDKHHLNDSNISDDGTTISLGSNVNVTGSIVVSGTVDGIDLQAFSSSVDGRLDTLEGETHENPLTFNDTSNVDLIRTSNTITANLKGGVVSGSGQLTDMTGDITVNSSGVSAIGSGVIVNDDVNATAGIVYTKLNLNGSGIVSGSFGGDVTGTIGALTVGKVQGVALTSDEATQLANIDTTTISTTQWGYLGALNQGLTTTSTVQFGKVGVGGASDATYELKVTGDIGATGDIVAYVSSDERLKDEITPIPNSLDKINQIGGYSFVWNNNQDIYKGKDYGVIAQEIESILPELVENRDNGYKAVKYDRLVSLLIEGIKDLHSEVQELKEKLKD